MTIRNWFWNGLTPPSFVQPTQHQSVSSEPTTFLSVGLIHLRDPLEVCGWPWNSRKVYEIVLRNTPNSMFLELQFTTIHQISLAFIDSLFQLIGVFLFDLSVIHCNLLEFLQIPWSSSGFSKIVHCQTSLDSFVSRWNSRDFIVWFSILAVHFNFVVILWRLFFFRIYYHWNQLDSSEGLITSNFIRIFTLLWSNWEIILDNVVIPLVFYEYINESRRKSLEVFGSQLKFIEVLESL